MVAPGLVAVLFLLPVPPPVSVPSLFCPFAADPAPSVPVPAAPLSSALPSAPSAPGVFPGPSFSSSAHLLFLASASSSFVAPDELLEDAAPDALPRDADSAVPAVVLGSARSEFRRMLSFLVDLFPQAAGTPAPPPPRALFEDFFGSSVPSSSPVFLSWFERVRTALSDADALLASFLSSGRSDFSFLPPRNSSYAVRGEFASGQAAPVNPLLLSLFEKQLKPSYHVGLTVREAGRWSRLSGLSLRPCPILCGFFLVCLRLSGSRILLQRMLRSSIRWSHHCRRALPIRPPCVLPTWPSGCFPHGLQGAETQAVLPVQPSCVFCRDE